jgi:hypothetical protein
MSVEPSLFAKATTAFFQTPLFLAATVGVPFCAFKYLFGVMAFRSEGEGASVIRIAGLIIMTWAAADLLMNLARMVYHLLGREPFFEYCTIAQAGRLLGMTDFFLAIDTALSFLIICLALWSGWIVRLNEFESYLWYAATTLNLISISIVKLWYEWNCRA